MARKYTSEKCLYPDELTFDKDDNICVSDVYGNLLFKFNREGKLM